MTSISSIGWERPRPALRDLRLDAALAVLLALSSPVVGLLYMRTGVYGENAEFAPLWLWVLGVALVALPLAVRRRYPVPVALLVSIGFFVCGQFGVPDMMIVQICMFMALYTVGAWERNRRLALYSRLGITAAMFAWVIINLIVASSDTSIFPGLPRSGLFSAFATFAAIQILTNLLYFGAAFLFGERSWRTARLHARLESQGRELDLERQTSAAQAVALDRFEIARELHDVVAHHVSVMGIQAAAARRSLARDPDRAASSLEIVENSARTAVDELRRLVHTLRSPEAEDGSTTVGIAQLGSLVADSQQTGVPTTLIVAGEPRPLPMLIDVALYRVAQEALTNTRKHAGRGAGAEVRLRFEADAIEIEIADDGVRATLGKSSAPMGASTSTETGIGSAAGAKATVSRSGLPGASLGLRGMKERIGAVGGTVQAGRRERGGFIVRARVPLAAAEGARA